MCVRRGPVGILATRLGVSAQKTVALTGKHLMSSAEQVPQSNTAAQPAPQNAALTQKDAAPSDVVAQADPRMQMQQGAAEMPTLECKPRR